MNPERLPIYELEPALMAALARGNRGIVQAPTGSGKSTQVPQMLLDHHVTQGQIVVLQPRRLAARLLAARVAVERGVRLGGEVGYQIRFEDISSPATRIKFVTEGILLRQMTGNPNLKGIGAILFDEFHERHLYGDITLARALQIQETTRPDLKVLVMSATLAADPLRTYLAPCEVLTSQGRMFPVNICYLDRPLMPNAPIWDAAVAAVDNHIRSADSGGDVLIFMPGAYEIGRTLRALEQSPATRGCIILPLHGELAPRDQDAAVARYDRRKIVVATNVAETSLTIDGVRLVVDAGFARVARYDPNRGINTLLIERISRAAADQRAGRAGRTAPGVCMRLWTEREQHERPAQELPEVRRLDLAEVVLTLKAHGITDVQGFRWLEPPEPRALARAETLLADLGALDARGAISELGLGMLAFPLHPRYARMLLAARDLGCVYQAALIAALTQGRGLFVRRPGAIAEDARDLLLGEGAEASDFLMLMRAWDYAAQKQFSLEACQKVGIHAQTARQVRQLLEQILRIAQDEGLPVNTGPASDDAICQCALAGFADHLATLEPGTRRCTLVHGRRGVLAADSVVRKSALLVAAEVHEIEQRGKELTVQLALASAVRMEWLEAQFPDDFREDVAVAYDNVEKRVVAESRRLFRDLPLSKRRIEPPPADAAARLLATEVLAGRITLKEWDHAVDEWIARVNCLNAACPELGLSPIGAEERAHMVEQICHGAHSARTAKERPVWPVIRAWLGPAQAAQVDQLAPERVLMPSGHRARLTYGESPVPFVSARIQDLYGMVETPRIARGRIALQVRILAPNQRPVQITQDLASFWRDHYPKLKQELQRKYPKHEWR